MQLTFQPARLSGFAILAVASAAALSLGACSSSHNDKSPAASPPAAGQGKGNVHGLIASVSGNAVQVTETAGTATVDVSPKTKVTEYTKAQLTDVAAGNCVSVFAAKPAAAPGGPVTANSVQLTPQGRDGKCLEPKNARPRQVIGTVASVADNTIHVSVIDANGNPATTDVTVTDKTQYAKQAAATSEAIAQGKCLTAQGTKDSGGTLKAAAVALGPAQDGKCPEPAAAKEPPR